MQKFPIFLALLFLLACKSGQSIQTLQIAPNQQVLLLDSLAATKAIIVDEAEHFFDYITLADMSIQMKQNFPANTSRETALKTYRAFLQKDVTSFTPRETAFLEKVFQKVYTNTQLLAPDIMTQQIKLIKTHSRHYGPEVYYTRENCIVIPKGVLEQANFTAFYNVMLHEVFHIYSRYNESKRHALYELIGFKPIGNPKILKMKAPLRDRILLNPDGVNYAYAIDLKLPDGKAIRAIPIIYSSESGYVSSKKQFFDYLGFNLFPIQAPYSKLIQVESDAQGKSALNLGNLPDFHRQIRDNTGYIIHPDEIMADNFMYLINSLSDEQYLDKFSTDGRALIQAIREIIQN